MCIRDRPSAWPTPPALVAESAPTTVVAPKMVVPPPVVTVVNPFVPPLTTRLPPAVRILFPLAVNSAVNPLISTRLISVPIAVTVLPKSFNAAESVMLLLAALMPVVPLTAMAPVCRTSPALLTPRFPPIVVAPKLVVLFVPLVVVVRLYVLPLTTRAPPADSTLLPLAVNAAANPEVFARLISLPTAVTDPLKSFNASVSVMFCPAALREVVPVTDSLPVWLTAPALVTPRFPVAVVAPKVTDPVAIKAILVPERLFVVISPPIVVMLILPLPVDSIVPPVSWRTPAPPPSALPMIVTVSYTHLTLPTKRIV